MRHDRLAQLLRESYAMLEVPLENYGLYARYPSKPDTRPRWRRFRDEVVHRLTGAWDCLMGRGE